MFSRWVAAHTAPQAVIWCNVPYAGGLIAAFAHRVLAMAMFYEVRPLRPFDPLTAADTVIWFKDQEQNADPASKLRILPRIRQVLNDA